MIIGNLVEIAEAHLGAPVKNACVSVPAYFDYAQRQATRDACRIAGINVLRICSTSADASVAYALQEIIEERPGKDKEKNVLFFDIGGSSVEASVAVIESGIVEIRAVIGHPHLGGEDFDDNMILHFIKHFKRKHRKDLTTDARALCRLRAACERAKLELSSATETCISIENLHCGIDFHDSISRAQFEEMNMTLFKKALAPIEMVCCEFSSDSD